MPIQWVFLRGEQFDGVWNDSTHAFELCKRNARLQSNERNLVSFAQFIRGACLYNLTIVREICDTCSCYIATSSEFTGPIFDSRQPHYRVIESPRYLCAVPRTRARNRADIIWIMLGWVEANRLDWFDFGSKPESRSIRVRPGSPWQ
jgi:hypothetical protein